MKELNRLLSVGKVYEYTNKTPVEYKERFIPCAKERTQGTAKNKDCSRVKTETKRIHERFLMEGEKIGLSENILFCCIKWYKRALKEDFREVLTLAYEIYQANNGNEKGACITLKAMALNRIERNKAGATVDDLTALVDLSINSNRHGNKNNVFVLSLDAMLKPIGDTPTDDDTPDTTELDVKAIEATQTSGIAWRYTTQAHDIAQTAFECQKSLAFPLVFDSSTTEGKKNQRMARKLAERIKEVYPDVVKLTPIALNHLVQCYAQGTV